MARHEDKWMARIPTGRDEEKYYLWLAYCNLFYKAVEFLERLVRLGLNEELKKIVREHARELEKIVNNH